MTKRRARGRIGTDGLSDPMYEFFAWDGTLDRGWGEDLSDAQIDAVWRQHKPAILGRYISEMRAKGPGWAGRRPRRYFAECEAEHPRRKIRTASYWGPWTKNGPPKAPTEYDVFEGDLAFVVRLGVAEPWEIAEYEKRKMEGKEDDGYMY